METAVPVCRSLGRGGVPVIAYGHPDDPVRHSRYCSRFVETRGAGEDAERGWLEALCAEPAAVLAPCSDKWVELIAHNREALAERGHVPLFGCDEASLAMLDKGRAYEIAERAGVPMPGRHRACLGAGSPPLRHQATRGPRLPRAHRAAREGHPSRGP
jgi:predicted ATP-grasp superfamily ATP-dependent carboligase